MCFIGKLGGSTISEANVEYGIANVQLWWREESTA
jgi:hypothetical protein